MLERQPAVQTVERHLVPAGPADLLPRASCNPCSAEARGKNTLPAAIPPLAALDDDLSALNQSAHNAHGLGVRDLFGELDGRTLVVSIQVSGRYS